MKLSQNCTVHYRTFQLLARNAYLHRFVLQHDIPPGTYSPQWRYFLVEKYDSRRDRRCKCWFHLVNLQACMFLGDKLLSKTKEEEKRFRVPHFTASIAFPECCFTFFTFLHSSSYSQSHLGKERSQLKACRVVQRWTKAHWTPWRSCQRLPEDWG